MTKSLFSLSQRINKEIGFISEVIVQGEQEKIIGGKGYETYADVGFYRHKFEIFLRNDEYWLKLPLGQEILERTCISSDEVICVIKEHFARHFS